MPNNPNAAKNLVAIKKGQVLNPKGWPKGVPHSSTRLRRLLELTQNLENPITGELEGFSVAEQMDLAQIMKAREGDTLAYKTIVDRLEGTPQQSVDMTTKGKELPTPILGGASAIQSDDSSTETTDS